MGINLLNSKNIMESSSTKQCITNFVEACENVKIYI